jgi:hypothetical protein
VIAAAGAAAAAATAASAERAADIAVTLTAAVAAAHDPTLVAACDLVEAALIGKTADLEMSAMIEIQGMAEVVTKNVLVDAKDAVKSLGLSIRGVSGERGLYIISAYNVGMALLAYMLFTKSIQSVALRRLKEEDGVIISQTAASQFLRFVEVINKFDRGIEFVYACEASWREVRKFLKTVPGEEYTYLYRAFDLRFGG